jgi:uncharacterized cysteine cluster protein YcgN (CxxCxxCC family)
MPFMKQASPHFWQYKTLEEMTSEEWESLCDRCAKCCLHRLEDEDTREIYFTNVHCRLLDTDNSCCSNYQERSKLVSDCVTITVETLEDPYWLPSTCAYRLLAEGKPLADWHPLVSGDPESVYRSGNGITGRTICEDDADRLDCHLIDWIK